MLLSRWHVLVGGGDCVVVRRGRRRWVLSDGNGGDRVLTVVVAIVVAGAFVVAVAFVVAGAFVVEVAIVVVVAFVVAVEIVVAVAILVAVEIVVVVVVEI
jgi:hypothetical protein